MAKLAAAHCPNCGAVVDVDPANDWAKCRYCGTRSFVERPLRPRPPSAQFVIVPPAASGQILPQQPPIYPYVRPASRVRYRVAVWLVLALVLGAGALTLSRKSATKAPASSERANAAIPTAVVASAPLPEPVRTPASNKRPILADLDGDGSEDLVLAVTVSGTATHDTYAVFAADSGKLRFEVEPQAQIYSRRAVVALGKLFVVDEKGELRGYDGANGSRSFSVALGERAARFCSGPGADVVSVWLRDGRQVLVDRAGKVSEATKKAKDCAALASDEKATRDLENFNDESAPAGTESYTCGGIQVTGDRQYFVPDRCVPKTGLDDKKLGGFELGAIWRVDAGWLLLGSKQPGTRVPMLGLGAKNALVWSAAVPAGNPLEAAEGRPSYAAVTSDAVVVGYAQKSAQRVVCFALKDGARRWDVALADTSSVDGLVAGRRAVYASAMRGLTALGLGDGRVLFELTNR